MNQPSDVLFEEQKGKDGNVGIITLNRPHALNALNHGMIIAMYQQLQIWKESHNIKLIFIRGAGDRAFCAGGDLRYTYDRYQKADQNLTHLFRVEYQLNQLIFHYPKPYVAWLDGITMGGGVGISIHGSYRVGTERLVFAMPETGIGFFPDVGGTYFLPRLSRQIGFYLGLTGARLSGEQCYAAGIVQYQMPSNQSSEAINRLANEVSNTNLYEDVHQVLAQFTQPTQTSTIDALSDLSEHHFSAESVEEILQNLQSSQSDACGEVAQTLLKKSPTSLKVTLRALQQGKTLTFDQCMQQELGLTHKFLQAHDFFEGIRALIIDKDQNPKWQPDSLSAVTPSKLMEYFYNPAFSDTSSD